jgi:hypothetical protein
MRKVNGQTTDDGCQVMAKAKKLFHSRIANVKIERDVTLINLYIA